MSSDKKAKYLTVALNICNLALNQQQVDLIVNLYDLVLEKKGETDLESIIKVKIENKEKFKNQNDLLCTT